MTSGLIIGKFLPPHAGHEYLVHFAQQQVDRLNLVLFSKTPEPIPGHLRAAWLRELFPAAAVHHLALNHPVNYADPAAWDFWVSALRSVLPGAPDLVFSSEAYGDELARRLGARHVTVDAARTAVPISAAAIRARPMTHWRYLPPPVRPYFVRRVCLLGAESTGKTTLAAALADHYHTVWVPEYAREYLAAHDNTVTPRAMLEIAHGQVASEQRLGREANRLLIGDTSLLTTLVWHEHYYGHCPDEIRRLADDTLAHHYFLCGLDVPWVADGLRDRPNQRAWFHQRYCDELTARGLPYTVLAGPPAARLARAIESIASLLADR
jgi:HTH-type transcriptional regulator, transcriptional repressor of NAD biosynthesis genes